jgi:hypothetical protein
MTDREKRFLLRGISIALDHIINHGGGDPVVALIDYKQRLARAWNIPPTDVTLQPGRASEVSQAELTEIMAALNAAERPTH